MRTLWKGISGLENTLFTQTWLAFSDGIQQITDSEFPGVYLLALSKESLVGKPIREKDVAYVGMSNYASLRKRLRNFKRGLKHGRGHSAANKLQGKIPRGHRFFVAGVAIKCETDKGKRSPDDLRKMGLVAALEMAALARVRDKTGHEPRFNTK